MKCDIQIVCRKDSALPTKAALQKTVCFLSQALFSAEEQGKSLTIRIVEPDESQLLNKTYRHQDKPTNVLSFPEHHDPTFKLPVAFQNQLGDLVLCHSVILKEAEAQKKTASDHYTHLLIHGVLHLLGYDHEEEDDAARMEQLEIDLLGRLNINNPYKDIAHES